MPNKLSVFTNKKVLLILVGSIILYLASAGVSYMVFNTVLKGPVNISTPFGSLTDVTSGFEEGTKDKACPLNGVFYTKNRQEQWTKRRPLGVMIENHQDARPPLGLSRADVIYEAIAEGGITRFLAIYLCQDTGDIAPIRSARTYFLDWVVEYDAAYAHVGGANTPGPADALGQIRDYDIRDMDQFGLGFPTYWRGTDKLAPHNVHSTTKKLWEAAEKRGFGSEDDKGLRWDKNFQEWKFKDDATLDIRDEAKPIVVPFWTQAPDYTVTWQYDKNANVYKRYHGQTAQIDPVTNEQLSAKSIIVQFQVETSANDGYPDGHLLYKTTGSGNALIFMDGKAVRGTWSKKDRTKKTTFYDKEGQEITFNRGQVWIETIPVGNTVEY
ncbi:hypothetical protein A2697_01965 [Candidatus Curtissbacteria bacterium RIFCSPHIGHO2_01_FULL_41_44]|uniref:DUF3048 domain-containing protein n=1 Tax=Candidatus Curtissbacteria bacterium RIFCSPLOWO2_01_FULL_42_50 TaxID=1797730 RepID=A0A1F5H3V6_9BACT|nr:MAG: hypothetical protein A2697_01965 [Candidatus Curtissbacteria bacterium RIFCSPHIGHO2_01_FULL_41_44]OGD94626.1 MAG: hypothetical protein A3C33_01115 [Candidatus Curtissbacteria bacterium RIFCSPHIGHO2_02_FULL_42_58]OGD96939.1 MAG: hypothetical protein A3E71_00805 [Candidatus Curtissbacteria bacterium RIFCSPHIGHO2_12_FULL_42_33]OGD98791.1 MAG: hypothetical protein A3B54_03840 [Candidatus Curtissbacteria bacterium RIFCSPLOWO2_01_FULL_42_50]OGE11322.1 MAG: hypothetical protein A3H87_03770 [Ca